MKYVQIANLVSAQVRTHGITLCSSHFQVDGQSHVVHSEEEALGTRLTIDSLTCLLANEHDPSRLIASSPGKLVRHTVEDGDRVGTDQPYAEVEVRLKLSKRAFISNSA